MSEKIIVLAADERYSEKVITTIKSICYHNCKIKFYLLNRDFSKEWFDYLNCFLAMLGSQIIDVKINSDITKNYKTLKHISSDSTYFRYFIPTLINEDKVLYLDSDLIVNGSLDAIFELNLEGCFLAACIDNIAKSYHNELNFNAGVLLINNKLWKENNITQIAIELSNQYVNQLRDGDQSILNLIFKDKWLQINQTANYLVGAEYIYLRNKHVDFITREKDAVPLILHFNTEFKPWLPIYDLPFRQYYWFYYQLSWNEIIEKWTK